MSSGIPLHWKVSLQSTSSTSLNSRSYTAIGKQCLPNQVSILSLLDIVAFSHGCILYLRLDCGHSLLRLVPMTPFDNPLAASLRVQHTHFYQQALGGIRAPPPRVPALERKLLAMAATTRLISPPSTGPSLAPPTTALQAMLNLEAEQTSTNLFHVLERLLPSILAPIDLHPP